MATSKSFFEYAVEQLSPIGNVSFRAMMGEYVIYYKGKVIGGIYDDRVLVKPTASAKKALPSASYEIPYDGAKPMILISIDENPDELKELFEVIYQDLK